jgi:Ca2+-binding RTX toxin-like protein
MSHFDTIRRLSGLLCLLLAVGFTGAAKAQDAYDMQNAGPLHLLGQGDLVRIEFTALSSDDLDIEFFEWDAIGTQWVSITIENNVHIPDGHFNGGGAGAIFFYPSGNFQWEFHLGTQGHDSISYHSSDGGVIAIGLGGSDNIQMTNCTIPTLLIGGDGADYIEGGSDRDNMYGGYPTMSFTSYGTNELHGMDGDDWIFADDGGDYIAGHDGSDYLIGGLGDDTIYAHTGLNTGTDSNYIEGRNGDDIIFAGGGGDTIYGDDIADSAHVGDDEIYGGDGGDTIYGGPGKDLIVAGDGINVIWGDSNMAVDYWNNNNDAGGASDDIWCGDGGNLVYGGLGDDLIVGGADDDELHGGDGNDAIFSGNAGFANEIYGDSGDNLMVANSTSGGVATYVYSAAAGYDSIVVSNGQDNDVIDAAGGQSDIWRDTYDTLNNPGTHPTHEQNGGLPGWHDPDPVTMAYNYWNNVLSIGRN